MHGCDHISCIRLGQTEEDWHIEATHGLETIGKVDSMHEAERSAEKTKLKAEIKDLLDPIQIIMDEGVDNVTKIRHVLEKKTKYI